MTSVLLVAVLTLPGTQHVAYEVNGEYRTRAACETARKNQVNDTKIPTRWVCLKPSKD